MTKQGGWPATGFGQRLREEREARGLTQQKLAELAGCHSITLSKLERGESEPAWPLVLALAQALEIEVGQFIPAGPVSQPTARPRGRPRKAAAEAEPAVEPVEPPAGRSRRRRQD